MEKLKVEAKLMRLKTLVFVVTMMTAGGFLSSSSAAGIQFLRGNVPKAIARFHLQPIGRLPATNHLNLAIALPLQNRKVLTNLLEQIYDPASTNYHKYLTSQQFTEMFGPTEKDYQALIAFAKSNRLKVTSTYPNRMLVDVSGSVADIEKALHVTMHLYHHPTENRTFFASDTEPSLNLIGVLT